MTMNTKLNASRELSIEELDNVSGGNCEVVEVIGIEGPTTMTVCTPEGSLGSSSWIGQDPGGLVVHDRPASVLGSSTTGASQDCLSCHTPHGQSSTPSILNSGLNNVDVPLPLGQSVGLGDALDFLGHHARVIGEQAANGRIFVPGTPIVTQQ